MGQVRPRPALVQTPDGTRRGYLNNKIGQTVLETGADPQAVAALAAHGTAPTVTPPVVVPQPVVVAEPVVVRDLGCRPLDRREPG